MEAACCPNHMRMLVAIPPRVKIYGVDKKKKQFNDIR